MRRNKNYLPKTYCSLIAYVIVALHFLFVYCIAIGLIPLCISGILYDTVGGILYDTGNVVNDVARQGINTIATGVGATVGIAMIIGSFLSFIISIFIMAVVFATVIVVVGGGVVSAILWCGREIIMLDMMTPFRNTASKFWGSVKTKKEKFCKPVNYDE
tara:strand:- start:5810 stop:6286 length:477 start_codon:yes stop_codon:yes gene_type:complete